MSITPVTPSELDEVSNSRRRGRWMLVVVIVILLAIFVPPFISLNRLKGRVGATIGNSLGRRVSVGRISLRLLPQPGFDLTDVTIHDDPAFSAEPMLHADSMTATLRLSSLWRRSCDRQPRHARSDRAQSVPRRRSAGRLGRLPDGAGAPISGGGRGFVRRARMAARERRGSRR